MEGTRPARASLKSARRFREQPDEHGKEPVEVGLRADAPLEVYMTDEPGGDPYNHTGRFRRMFR